jgi:hypothetical protein
MRFITCVGALLALVGPAAAQKSADSPAASRRLAISGFGEVSYSYSTRAVGSTTVGRLYNRLHDQAQLNALTVTLDLPHDPGRRSAGVHAQVLFGQNMTVIKSAGFALGDQGMPPSCT